MTHHRANILLLLGTVALLACSEDGATAAAGTGGMTTDGGGEFAGGAAGATPASGGSVGGIAGMLAGSGGATAAGGAGGVLPSGGAAGLGAGGVAAGGGVPSSAGAGGTPDVPECTADCDPATPPSSVESIAVDMCEVEGAPTYRASGFIYGISRDGSQPPESLLTDIKTRFLRVGGAQIGCPNGGYVNGQYAPRWDAVKAYYEKAKAIGATVLILTHDLWGADAVCSVPSWPGDNGDWTRFEAFMAQVIDDAKASGMTGPDVRWDLWNEPDYPAFWGRSREQWLETWKRAYQMVRAAIPDAIIEGPSVASGPGGQWFSAFLDYAKANDVVPDYIGWHEAGGGVDPVRDAESVRSSLASRGIDVENLDISEYGSPPEQNPGHSAWYVSRIERANVDALRSNWGMGGGLYAGLGDLVTSNWEPLGQWWIYKRYADQTGLRTRVTPGDQIDAVAFQDSAAKRMIVVVGNRGGARGAINVTVTHVASWLQENGMTRVLVERMPAGNTPVEAPTVVSDASAEVACNSLTVTIDWSQPNDGYAITLTQN